MGNISREEQKRVVCEVLDEVKERVLSDVYFSRIPHYWEKIQLRQMLTDYMNSRHHTWHDMDEWTKGNYMCIRYQECLDYHRKQGLEP